MSYSKILLIVAGFVVAVGISVTILLKRKSQSTDQQVADAISILKENPSGTRDCEAFEKLVALSTTSKRATTMVAEMYARGMCQPFNLEKSIEWFEKAGLSSEELGQALFQAARWEIPADESVGPSKDQIELLLGKAKEVGFRPSKTELDQLPQEYRSVFL